MDMDWQPSNEGLAQIVGLLRESRSTVPGVQLRIHQQLQTFHAIPDYNNYLVYIFSRLKAEDEFVRTVAGLLLKNNIKDYYNRMPKEVQNYVKKEVLSSIGDPLPGIRRTVSSIVTTIVTKGKIEGWPSLMQSLIHLLDSTDPNVVEGALSTVFLICEDNAGRLDSEEAGRPLNILIPKLLMFFRSPNENFRRYALASLNHFIVDMPGALLVSMDNFMQGIFFLSSDPSAEVRRKVCQALVTLLEVRQDFLIPHVRNVVQYMLHSTQDPDENVALEACEFWSSLAELPVCKSVLQEFLPALIPVLLNRMVYSEIDLAVLECEGEDEMKPDEAKDIRPRFHQSKVHASGGGAISDGHDEANEGGADEGIDDDDDDDDDDDYDANDEESTEWNLRKCSAAGLDILSSVFQDEILPILLPLINDRIRDQNPWYVRESGILAIGAIAEGCIQGMKAHLPSVVPYLISLLNDSKPLVRSITCWSLSRYSKWIVQQPAETYLQPMMMHLLNRILDSNKKVQEAACSAFATLEEEAQADLIPYLQPILQTLVAAFSKYQAKNLLILYDAIGTLADSVGHELNKPELVCILMPPLIEKWNQLADTDRNLFPLLECLTSIATALGVGFQPFAQPVYMRCLKLIEGTLVALAAYRQHPDEKMELPDKEFIVCAIDLISGLVEGLGTGIESLVAGSNLLTLLAECMKDRGPDVRQSAFALVGDLAKNCIFHLKPFLPEFITMLTNNLYPDFISVCNNASWALGEIAVKIGEDMKPYILPAVHRLVPIMNKLNLNRNLLENTAITLGRLGLVAPESVAPHLEEFVQPWCLALRNIRDDIEKDSAFRGMCMMIKHNPNGAVKHLIYICDAIASWFYPQDDLREMFFQILHMYKNGMGDAWVQYYKNFPEQLRAALHERYSL
jgi:hypothetical protein